MAGQRATCAQVLREPAGRQSKLVSKTELLRGGLTSCRYRREGGSCMVSFKINRPATPAKAAGSRSPRRRVLIDGQFQSLMATYQIAVRNLSCTGALVESKVPLKVDTQGVLATPHLDCFCKIIWT